MLSNRLHWMTCIFALMLLPMAAASEPDAEETRDYVVDEAERAEGMARDHARDEAHKLWDEVRHQYGIARDEVDTTRDEAEYQKEVAMMILEYQLNSALGLVQSGIDTALGEVGSVQGEAERRIPTLQTMWGEGDEAPDEDVSMAPSASKAAPLDIKEPLLLVSATAAAAGVLFWLAGSTGAAKAGGAATSSMAGKDLRRLLPYASPLFTRFERDTVLGHPKREALYAEIMSKPGVTLQDLCEETGLSRTAVSHHLRLLEQQHLIVSKRMGRSRHFFENGGRYGRDQKDAYAVLHNDRSKDVHSYISDHPGAIQKDLCEALGIQASVAHWHVKRLQEASLIESVRQGRTVSYFPTQTAAYA